MCGSEMVAKSKFLSTVKDLRYKLYTMVVFILMLGIVFVDSNCTVYFKYIPIRIIKKRHLGICYHAVCEASAVGIWKVDFSEVSQNIETSSPI